MSKPSPTIAIIGVGLLGGSIGKAALTRGVARKVIGIHRDGDAVGQAIKLGATSSQTYIIEEGVADADLIFVCTPAGAVVEKAQLVALHCPPHAVITDVASTKQRIVAELVGLPIPFVGGHPLAGSHSSGVEAARADLFQGERILMTPAPHTDENALKYVESFWQSLGARVQRISPAQHDATMAATSHLPHWLASALAAVTPRDCLSYAASGWRDTTRVAAGNTEVWRDIFLQNRDEMLKAHTRLAQMLQRFHQALQANDPEALLELLEQGKQIRDAVGS